MFKKINSKRSFFLIFIFCYSYLASCKKENEMIVENDQDTAKILPLRKYLADGLDIKLDSLIFDQEKQQFYLSNYDIRFDLKEVQQHYNRSFSQK